MLRPVSREGPERAQENERGGAAGGVCVWGEREARTEREAGCVGVCRVF